MKEKIAVLKSEIENDYKKINKILTKFEKAYTEFNNSKSIQNL